MADFQRATHLFDFDGQNYSAPIDRLPQKRARLLYNTRKYGLNRLQSRQGIQPESANAVVAAGPHSLFSWNDPIPDPTAFPGSFQPHNRLMGVSTDIAWAGGAIPPGFFTILDTGYSGFPMTFVVAGSDFSPRPWTFLGDFSKTRKISSAGTDFHMGVAPPNFAPTAAILAPLPTGPDIGTTNLPYVYRFRARCDTQVNTGAVSNLGPPIRDVNGLSPSSAPGAGTPPSSILVTVPTAHPDPQVRWLDVYRYGGSLPVWTYIGTIGNVAGFTLYDGFADLDIASNPVAEFNDNQPFLTVGTSIVGTCNVTPLGTGLGCTVTIVTGDTFKPYDATGDNPFYPLGNQIAISGTNFTFYASPTSTTVVEILEDSPAITGGDFVMNTPEIMHQPLPCMWGPFGGGLTGIFIFACGDALRSGAIYWTKGNQPESHPGANVLDITSASEPLMNGVLYNGNPFVFSTDRMFALYPTLGQVSDFSALEIPNSRGLFARWGLCVTPWGMAFIAKDGIYLTAGGSPTSLTDEDLYPFFPHESSGLDPGPDHFPFIDGIDDTPISRPDFRYPEQMRLDYGDGFLYWNYLDQSGHYRTMVGNFDVPSGRFTGWISRDTYTPEVTTRFFETVQDTTTTPGISTTRMLLGVTTGFLATYGESMYGVDTDFGNAIDGLIRTGAMDTGDPRPRKFWGDIEVDLDSKCNTIDIYVGFDNFSSLSSLATGSTNLTGRHRLIGDINAGRGQYAYNLGLYVVWASTSGQPIFYTWTPTWVPKPELTALRVTDWTDCGYMGAKFMQGFILRADTLNVARTVTVLDDSNVAHSFTPTTVQHNGEQTIAYSFNTPFISHLVRFAPSDPQFWRIEEVQWVHEPAPELVTTWETQETTFDYDSFFHHRDLYLPVVSTDVVTLVCTITGNNQSPYSYPFASTSGVYQKAYLVTQPMKGLAAKYSATSPAGFRVMQHDMSVGTKPWGSQGPYLYKQPFGGLTRMNGGARI